MKRKSGKALVDFNRKVSVIHFNVGSGYVTYLVEESPDETPRVKNIVIAKAQES